MENWESMKNLRKEESIVMLYCRVVTKVDRDNNEMMRRRPVQGKEKLRHEIAEKKK